MLKEKRREAFPESISFSYKQYGDERILSHAGKGNV